MQTTGSLLRGRLTSTDSDAGQAGFFRLASPAPAGFSLQEDGSWTFNPANSAYSSLQKGERRVISVAYQVDDRITEPQPALPNGVIRVGGPNAQFTSIQDAINQSPPGSILYIAPGTYNENLLINKDITLLGAFYGIPAGEQQRGQNALETTIRGYINVTATAAKVSIDGVTLIGSSGGVNARFQSDSARLVNSIITSTQPQGGFADFAFVKFFRENSLPTGFNEIVVENNIFNGILNTTATPVVVQINRANSTRVQGNHFNNTGGGGNIVIAQNSGDILIRDNLIIGGGKGVATYDGVFQRLNIENNTIINSNFGGIEINANSDVRSGSISGNIVNGSGIDSSRVPNQK
jgi:VCBS repeat-containing protein